jgi:hypothetical protein
MLILVCGFNLGLYSFSLFLDSLRIHLRYYFGQSRLSENPLVFRFY